MFGEWIAARNRESTAAIYDSPPNLDNGPSEYPLETAPLSSVPGRGNRQDQVSEYRPKVITAFMYLPNMRYFLLNLEIRNRMGDLAAVSSLLAEGKFDILNGSFFRGENGTPGFWQVYVLPLKPQITSDELGKLLTACPDVLSFEIKESKDGFLVDSLTFPIKLSSGQRAMIIRNEIWNSILQKTREKFSSGGDVIIYDQGVTAGRVTGNDLLKQLGREKISRQLDQVVALYQSLGWGKAGVLSFRPSP